MEKKKKKRSRRRRAALRTKTSVTFSGRGRGAGAGGGGGGSPHPPSEWTSIQATQTPLCHGVCGPVSVWGPRAARGQTMTQHKTPAPASRMRRRLLKRISVGLPREPSFKNKAKVRGGSGVLTPRVLPSGVTEDGGGKSHACSVQCVHVRMLTIITIYYCCCYSCCQAIKNVSAFIMN